MAPPQMGPVAGLASRFLMSSQQTWRSSSTAAEAAAYPLRVGFIGLGSMGSRMAANLLKAGHLLTVHDRDAAALQACSSKGAAVAQSPRGVAEQSDVVITMLPSSENVIDVYSGDMGMLMDGLRPSLLIDCSTIEPKVSRDIAAKAQTYRLAQCSRDVGGEGHPIVVDAPVSGGAIGAEAASLSFMVGGPEKGLKAAEPLLLAMGKRIISCGESGNGATAKLCNNMALAVSMAAISEALVLGQKLGIDARTLTSILNCSSARCWSSDTCNPVPGVMAGVPASRDYEGGFATQLMTKDLKLVLQAAEEAGCVKTPLAATVYDMYLEMCRQGYGKKDFSGIFSYLYKGQAELVADEATSIK